MRILFKIFLFIVFYSLSFLQVKASNEDKLKFDLPASGNYVFGNIIEKNSKQPLVGVTVRVEGFSHGVISDVNGNYVLKLPRDEGVIIFSYIGFETRKIKVKKREQLNVSMVESNQSIKEVIVTGYLPLKKESFTGNTVKVEIEEIKKVNPNNLLSAIQTFDPSFRLQENLAAGSDPNSLPQFQLRGQTGIGTTTMEDNSTSSISKEVLVGNSNLPIFILDGFEVDVQKIYDLDMNSIHSLTILKDAAATAMYGSRAANGVVVIERRAPEAGKFRVQYSGGLTLEVPDLSSYNLMNASEKLEAERMAGLYESTTPEIAPYTNGYYQRLNNVINGVDTYWLSKGLRSNLSQKHSVFIDGGENDVRWGVEMGLNHTNGLMKYSSRKGANVAFFVDYRFKGLQIKNKVTYTYNKSTNVPFNSFSDYSHLLPYMRLYDADGKYVRRLESFESYSGTLINPLYEVGFYNSTDESSYNEVTNDLSLNWIIVNGLRLKGQISLLKRDNNTCRFQDPASANYIHTASHLRGEKTESSSDRTIIDGNISLLYNKTLSGHNVNLCLSGNIRQTDASASEARYRGFPGGKLTSSNYAYEVIDKPSSSDNKTRTLGLLMVANYSYNNIYLADVTGRMDGSSEFGSDKKWSMFWATGLGININNYDFLKDNQTISTLRLRASYGLTGKTNFSLFSAKDMYQLNSESWYPTGYGVFLYQMGNNNLKWERKYTLDYGFELGLWHDRLTLKASSYDERTIDLITDYTIPSSTGFTSYKENMGKVKNVGIELDARYLVFSNTNWMFQIYGNFSKNKNTIIEISQAMRDYNKKIEELFKNYNPNKDTNQKYAQSYLKYYEGASLTSIYGMTSLGISPTNGKEIYLKRNGEVTDVWSADEWSVIGNSAPKGQGSFGYTLAYKNLSMFSSFLYTYGGDSYNNTLVSQVENADIKNTNVDKRVMKDRWQKPGDITTMKDISNRNITTGASSRFIQKNNTLQWNSITLSYQLSEKVLKKFNCSSLRLSLTMNDILYWSTVRQERGLDYPYAKSFNFTANVSF